MRFRPCIDLHAGRVKQIVGSSLNGDLSSLQTNFSSSLAPSHYAEMYRRDNLQGGHVIMLGPGNDKAALDALAAWPGGLQVGGGITATNAKFWLEQGASHVIVTSWVFYDGSLDYSRINELTMTEKKKHLVLDLSCRWNRDAYYVVTDRWQKFSNLRINAETLDKLSAYCNEFLVHAVDVEGKCAGLDQGVLALLAENAPLPTTYAGGISSLDDLEMVRLLGKDHIDATVGSALDIFGGTLRYEDVVAWHDRQ